MDKRVKVLSVFAGLGKTYVGKKYHNICDLASSKYRYDYSNIGNQDYEKYKSANDASVNPEWPDNYIQEIRQSIAKYDLVLVPSNEDIREVLVREKIDFIFVLPTMDSRDELIKRYVSRGNNQELINGVLDYFDNWSRDEKDYDYKIVLLDKDKYLEDLLKEWKYI